MLASSQWIFYLYAVSASLTSPHDRLEVTFQAVNKSAWPQVDSSGLEERVNDLDFPLWCAFFNRKRDEPGRKQFHT